MRIRLSTPGTNISIDIKDDEGMTLFSSLAFQLLNISEDVVNSPVVNNNTIAECTSSPIEYALPVNEDTILGLRPEKSLEIVKAQDDLKLKYKGFLYIKCEHCGKEHAFCSKEEIDRYICKECENITCFNEPLISAYAQCECGNKSKYMTNMDDFAFDIECINCKAPIAVKYHQKKNVYTTIR